MVALYLRRGLAAGLLAGLLAGLFAFVVGEPLLDRAIALEDTSHGHTHGHDQGDHAHGTEGEGEVFSRATQRVGLFFATGLSGTFVGGLFGLTFAYFRGRLENESDWTRSLALAAALFTGAVLIPFLKYPANPPTVGDPATIGARTAAYFAMVALSLLVVLGAWYAARMLKGQGISQPVRHVAVGLAAVVAVALLIVSLPASADPGNFPAGLLWSFRISSLGTQLVLWTGLGVVFGALCERAGRKGAA